MSMKIAVANHPGRNNWFHWLMQTLPQVKALYLSGKFDHVAVCCDSERHRESLDLLARHLQIPEGFILTHGSIEYFPSQGGAPSDGLVSSLRDAILPRRKIFISRAAYPARHILNEPELRSILEPNGFEFVAVESLTVVSQARLFHDADMIVGAHGSAWANLIFCRPGTQIVEIKKPSAERGWVQVMAAQAGCSYRMVPVPDREDAQIRFVDWRAIADE